MDQLPMTELSAILSGLSSLLVSSGLTYWVHKTHSATIGVLKDEITKLKDELIELKSERSRWYHKAIRLANIMRETKNCPHSRGCKVRAQFEKYVEEEGVI